PAAAPAPAPAPAVASPPADADHDTLVQAGWEAVEARDTATALLSFNRALRFDVTSPAANYGVGYVLLGAGEVDGAVRHLCRALPRAEGSDRREIEALLARRELGCP